MDKRLKKYNSVNANLGVMVEDLRVRQALIAKAIATNRDIIRNNTNWINSLKNSVYQVVQYTDDHEQLKLAIKESLNEYVKDCSGKNGDINPNIKQEYENQKKFLENSINSLKKRLEIESQIHKADNLQIMTDNMDLIQQIGDVRDNIVEITKRKVDSDNAYKNLCTRYGIKPAKSLDDLDNPDWLRENAKVLKNLRNPIKNQDDETLYHLRDERENRRANIEMLRQRMQEQLHEVNQLE